MKRRFVVLVDCHSVSERNRVTQFLRDSPYGWWSWIKNSWLVVDNSGDLTPASLRDMIGQVVPKRRLVIEVSDQKSWSGFGPSGEDRNMFTWLHNTWTTD